MGNRNQGGRRLRHSATRGAREAGPCRETRARALLSCALGLRCACAEAVLERAKRFFGDKPCRHITEFINSVLAAGRSAGADRRKTQRFAYLSRKGGRPARRIDPENRGDRVVYRPMGSGDARALVRQPSARPSIASLKRAGKGSFRNRARFRLARAVEILPSLYTAEAIAQPAQEGTP